MALVNITKDTVQDIKQILADQKITRDTLRIHGRIGWGGMTYSLVLDEPAQGDRIEEHEGLRFILSDSLQRMSGGFNVVAHRTGGRTYLSITPSNKSADGGDCSSCSSCG